MWQVRFLARSFGVPGNHLGQQSHGFRWPYGPVSVSLNILDFFLHHEILSFSYKFCYFHNWTYERIFLQVAIVTPFNFPLEIPVLQLMGALYMGNKPILKVDSKVFQFNFCWWVV